MKRALFALSEMSVLKTGATGGLELALFELYDRCSPFLEIDVASRQIKDSGHLPVRWELSAPYPSTEALTSEEYLSRLARAVPNYDVVVGFDLSSLCPRVDFPIVNIYISEQREWIRGGVTPACARHLYAFPGRWLIEEFRRAEETLADARCWHLKMGVDLAKFKPRPRSQKSSGFELCFAGQWIEPKGVFDYLEGANILAREIPDLRVHCAGDVLLWEFGDLQELSFGSADRAAVRARVESELAKLPNRGRLGRVEHSEMPGLWSGAALAVVPSRCTEAGPIVAVEALACGVPVVGSDVPGVNEVVKPGLNGELFEPGCPEDLAAKCLELYRDPERLARYRWNARGSVIPYSWEHSTQTLMDMIAELIDR